MSTSNVERLRDYLYRQYEVEEGSVEENLYALFAEDVVVQQGDGPELSRQDLVRTASIVRGTPKSERIVEMTDFGEDGDTVTFNMHVRFRNPETGELDETRSDNFARFNGQGKVVESRAKMVADKGVLYRRSGAAQE